MGSSRWMLRITWVDRVTNKEELTKKIQILNTIIYGNKSGSIWANVTKKSDTQKSRIRVISP